MRNVKIIGTGTFLPGRKVKSNDLAIQLGLAPGWIESKIGVNERYYVDQETASFMGGQAANLALASAGIALDTIDCIVSASGTMEQAIPCNAALIQKALGLENSGIPCFDINSTCLSFITALDLMSYLVDAGKYNRVLIVSSDIASVGLDWSNKETATLFGDGAAAAILTKTNTDEGARILYSNMETYSIGAHFAEIRVGSTIHPRQTDICKPSDFLFQMDGKKIYKLISKHVQRFVHKALEDTNLTLSDINMVIPHQASKLAMLLIQEKLGIPSCKYMNIINNYGNMIAVSIPFAMHQAIIAGKIKRGDKLMLLGSSAGTSLGVIILEY